HVAIDGDRSLAERRQIGGGAERAADEALDLLRATARALAASLARLAPLGARPRVHLVLGRDPTLAFAHPPVRPGEVDRRRAQDCRATGAVQDRTLRIAVEAERHLYGAVQRKRAAVGA